MAEPKIISIKDWAKEDRPREKMMLKGKAALSDAELLAILLRSGNTKETAVSLSQKILKDADHDLAKLSSFSIEKLMKFPGVGEAKALSIAAALELGRRKRESTIKKHNSINCSKDAYEYMQPALSDLQHEEFWAILLNIKNHIIARVPVSQGGTTNTLVDPKKIFRLAIEHNTVKIIICHNHPSGDIIPSAQDIKLTERLREGAKLLELMIIDHIIIGNEKYYSFADNNII